MESLTDKKQRLLAEIWAIDINSYCCATDGSLEVEFETLKEQCEELEKAIEILSSEN